VPGTSPPVPAERSAALRSARATALAVSKLGDLREGLLTAGLDWLIPAGLLSGARPDPVSTTTSVAVAATVIAGWALIPLAAGAQRPSTGDA